MSLEHDSMCVFRTKLRSFSEADCNFNGEITPQSKKNARKEISLAKTSETLGFLHSVLLEINNKYFLLAGPSGIGKSTHSEILNIEFGASLLAKDWVAVEKEENNFYASDLNFAESLKQTERSPLSGIIFLTHEDRYKRDAFVPNEKELLQLLGETFDSASDAELNKLSSFWSQNYAELPFLCAVPARRRSENAIAKTVVNLIKREETMWHPVEVGVVGIGSIGTELAFQLGQLPFVYKVHLYNRSYNKAVGYAMDMNQALPINKHDVFIAHTKPEDVIISSSSVFLSFRNESSGQTSPNLPERWQKLSGNLEILDQYIQVIGLASFEGTLFIITNPVDILTYALYQTTQDNANPLRTYQMYGIGLEVDAARALYYGRQIDPTLTSDSIRLYGNHSDEIVIKSTLSNSENARLSEAVNGASGKIRKFIPRTIFGPVGAAIRTFQAFQEGGQAHITTIQEDAFIGRKINFRNQLPLLAENILDEEYQSILRNNRSAIAAHLQS